jgi:hypothetical protein
MKECEQIGGLYIDLHDGRLDGTTEARVNTHFGECSGCREDYMWYGFTVRSLANLDEVKPPADFLEQLNSKIFPEKISLFDYFKNFFSVTPSLPLPVGVSALAVVLLAGVLTYKSTTGGLVNLSQPPDQARAPITNLHTSGKAIATSAISIRPATPDSKGWFPYTWSAHTPWSQNVSYPSIADRIGADNLTVESPSVDEALKSLKKVLPDMQGRLIDEKVRNNRGDTLVAIRIPSEAYANLTTELINHGAVATGAGNGAIAEPAKKDGDNVVLYIRFVRVR